MLAPGSALQESHTVLHAHLKSILFDCDPPLLPVLPLLTEIVEYGGYHGSVWSISPGPTLTGIPSGWTDRSQSYSSVLYVIWKQIIYMIDMSSAPLFTWIPFAGGSQRYGAISTTRVKAELYEPRAVCIDPSAATGAVFIADSRSIRYCDVVSNTMYLIAGAPDVGLVDDVGKRARFDLVNDLVSTQDGRTLYVLANQRIRRVDVSSCSVSTAGAGGARDGNHDGFGRDSSLQEATNLCFYRSSIVQPDSVLFIATTASIRQFNTTTSELSTLELVPKLKYFEPSGLGCTNGGIVIVACRDTQCVLSIDPTSGQVVRVAGCGVEGTLDGEVDDVARFAFRPFSCCVRVSDTEQYAYINESFSIRCVSLPPEFFVAPAPASSPAPLSATALSDTTSGSGAAASSVRAPTSKTSVLSPYATVSSDRPNRPSSSVHTTSSTTTAAASAPPPPPQPQPQSQQPHQSPPCQNDASAVTTPTPAKSDDTTGCSIQ